MPAPRSGRTMSNRGAGLSSPDSASGKLQRVVLERLRLHERDGELPTSARFLLYELVQAGILTKAKKDSGRRPDQALSEALMRLREIGLVPWEWIVDETRSLEDFTGWSSVFTWATTMVDHVRLDPWAGNAPTIITESRSLSGVLRDLANEYAVRLAATNGQCGGFLHTDIAPQLSPGDRVLYLGDFDWQGHQI